VRPSLGCVNTFGVGDRTNPNTAAQQGEFCSGSRSVWMAMAVSVMAAMPPEYRKTFSSGAELPAAILLLIAALAVLTSWASCGLTGTSTSSTGPNGPCSSQKSDLRLEIPKPVCCQKYLADSCSSVGCVMANMGSFPRPGLAVSASGCPSILVMVPSQETFMTAMSDGSTPGSIF
jgi:hypothetical protein